jgi:hypothetical protein
MIKRRPSISYEQFVETWQQLEMEGRAGTNTALDRLGGNKSTIIAFRERYEREKASHALAIIKSIELPEAVQQAIAGVKVKEVESLEKENVKLKTRIDEHLLILKETEEKLALSQVDLDDLKVNFDVEKLAFERKLAALQARIDDFELREQKLLSQHEQLSEKCNQAKQEAAVAKKEVEMLREQKK